MKYSGEALRSLATDTVKVPRPGGKFIEFLVRSTGLGDETLGDKLFPDPAPPSDFVYDTKGQIVRDNRTDKPIRQTNAFDPLYQQKQEYASRMQMIVKFVIALSMDDKVQWETQAPAGTKQYFEHIGEEMKAAGITLGDMKVVLEKARELNNLDSEKLQKAAEGFSQKGEAEE